MEIKPTIFKAYDVRGVYPAEFNEKAAEEIARALAGYWQRANRKARIVIGRDGRLSSPSLYKAVLKALEIRNSKLEILPAGIITTPMLYFLVNHLKAAGGIMITASHNPKEYNGLKVVGPKAKPINGTEIRELLDKGLS